MKTAALKYPLLTFLVGLSTLIFLLIPFHAFLTVWLASAVDHYTALRLWKEALLSVGAVGALVLILIDHKIRSHTLSRRLVWLIVIYGLVTLVSGLIALSRDDVTQKAFGYGLIVNLRFLAFFLITWTVALRTQRLRVNWQKFALWPAVVVVAIGLLQITVLPHDFLRHFGYGPHTIEPFETINHNPNYIRIMSTLRGPNPLGAYLIIPIAAWLALLIRGKRTWKTAIMLAGALIVIAFSFSRSAWIGALIAMLVVAALEIPARKLVRPAIVTIVLGVCFVIGLGLGLRHNSHAQNIFLHTETNSSIKNSSNDGHLAASLDGAQDILKEPLGEGTGTAGPASVYNEGHETRIAENYYLQIGQETGLLGMALFILICLGVAFLLYVRRWEPLTITLFGSLAGLAVVSLLSHTWTDDTLAYTWWGLAGIAMVPLDLPKPEPAENKKPVKAKRAIKA